MGLGGGGERDRREREEGGRTQVYAISKWGQFQNSEHAQDQETRERLEYLVPDVLIWRYDLLHEMTGYLMERLVLTGTQR